jgi:hypothetical protein
MTTQEQQQDQIPSWHLTQANALPARVGSPYEEINKAVIHVNQELAKGHNAQTIQELATEIEGELEQQEMLQTGSPIGNTNVVAR